MKCLILACVILVASSTLIAEIPTNFNLSTDYNATLGKEYAYVSRVSFCQQKNLVDWNCGAPCTLLPGYRFISGENVTQAGNGVHIVWDWLANDNDNKIVVVFRGTGSDNELLLEGLEFGSLNYTWLNVPGAVVDYYFGSRYFEFIREPFHSALVNLIAQYPSYQFVFTGISLGAAFATLAAHDAVISGWIDVEAQNFVVYNYGSPRVGNSFFAFSVDATIPTLFRVVHNLDIVPHVPPCGLKSFNPFQECKLASGDLGSFLWSPWHAGTEVWYNEDSTEYQICTTNSGEDPNCSDQYYIFVWTDHLDYFHMSDVANAC